MGIACSDGVNALPAVTHISAVAWHRTRWLIENRYPNTARVWSSKIFARRMRGREAIATDHRSLQSSNSFPSLSRPPGRCWGSDLASATEQ